MRINSINGYIYGLNSQYSVYNIEQNDLYNNCDLKKMIKYWRFDERGNIVYYTVDANTGELLSKEVYKNPGSNIFNN